MLSKTTPPDPPPNSPPPPSPNKPREPEALSTPLPEASASPNTPTATATKDDSRPASPHGPALERANITDEQDIIDMDIFNQILELDDDVDEDEDGEDGYKFSKTMILAYFAQATKTFGEMDEALREKNLLTLSTLGHFLKGSSAALGVRKVQASCEKIQHYGLLRDEDTDENLKAGVALQMIEGVLKQVKEEYLLAEERLKGFCEGTSVADSVGDSEES